jgi:hypothetical protein
MAAIHALKTRIKQFGQISEIYNYVLKPSSAILFSELVLDVFPYQEIYILNKTGECSKILWSL